MKSVIKEIGTFGNLNIQETGKSTPTIEISGGHKFECGLHEMFPEKKIKLNDARILLVDGAIQDVSEIDFLLQELNRTMEPLVIVARKFSNDVANTNNNDPIDTINNANILKNLYLLSFNPKNVNGTHAADPNVINPIAISIICLNSSVFFSL